MFLKRLVLLIFNLAVELLGCLLGLNHLQEGFALDLSLVSHHDFLLQELLLASEVQFSGLTSAFFSLVFFLGSELALSLLKCSFGP